ncbi:MAG TPA: right-handed parallel beta-helix repeat-containing protein [Polyangia bacterium]|nr:right-handed parallel beta-helix repeat-containing protein [Polyangia bacterium]
MALLLGLVGCTGQTYSLGTDCIPSGTEKELQAAIDTRKQVLLCQGAVMTLNAPVVLRQGTTLETIHRPVATADMAHIVLGADFAGNRSAVVGSGSDIHVAHVHFDGNRRVLGPQDQVELLRLGPGKTYSVTGCAFADASGWTHLHVVEPCSGAVISGNTVESAVRVHDTAHNTDGLSISCASSLVEDNSVNDISGVGIVYYGGPGTIIRNNTIIESTASAFSGINVGDAVRLDHAGVIIEQNTIRAIGSSYFHIGISAGLHAWRTKNISGVTVRRNAISGQIRYGLAVDGCVDCVVQDNQVTDWRPLPGIVGCPAAAPYIASVSNRHAGGTLQPGFADVTIDGCLGAPLPL